MYGHMCVHAHSHSSINTHIKNSCKGKQKSKKLSYKYSLSGWREPHDLLSGGINMLWNFSPDSDSGPKKWTNWLSKISRIYQKYTEQKHHNWSSTHTIKPRDIHFLIWLHCHYSVGARTLLGSYYIVYTVGTKLVSMYKQFPGVWIAISLSGGLVVICGYKELDMVSVSARVYMKRSEPVVAHYML